MIYADFESSLVSEDNEKQNPEESYTNKYQKTCCLQLWLYVLMINLTNLLNLT